MERIEVGSGVYESEPFFLCPAATGGFQIAVVYAETLEPAFNRTFPASPRDPETPEQWDELARALERLGATGAVFADSTASYSLVGSIATFGAEIAFQQVRRRRLVAAKRLRPIEVR